MIQSRGLGLMSVDLFYPFKMIPKAVAKAVNKSEDFSKNKNKIIDLAKAVIIL